MTHDISTIQHHLEARTWLSPHLPRAQLELPPSWGAPCICISW